MVKSLCGWFNYLTLDQATGITSPWETVACHNNIVENLSTYSFIQ